MNGLINELMEVLAPALKSRRRAQQLLERYWAGKIAPLWTTENVHRAANEKSTVLTEDQAIEVLQDLLTHYNSQLGLRWEDVTGYIEEHGIGRPIKKRELHRFIHKNVLCIDPKSKN